MLRLKFRCLMAPMVGFAAFLSTMDLLYAAMLEVSFYDPQGDGVPATETPTPKMDIQSLTLAFDSETGDYSILWTAYPDSPFLGRFRLNTLLYNVDASDSGEPLPSVDGIPQVPEWFIDNANDYLLSEPTESISKTGNSPVLTRWNLGNRVAANGGSFPEACCFGSGMIAFDAPNDPRELIGTPVTGSSQSGFDLDVQSTIQRDVPEPLSLTLLASAVLAVMSYDRRPKGRQ